MMITKARLNLAVEDEIIEEEVPSDDSVKHEIEDDEVSHIEFTLSILAITPGSNFIQNIDLDHFDEKDDN